VAILDSGVEQALSSGDGFATEDIVVDMNGWIVHLISLRNLADAREKLREVAGTDEQMTLWAGTAIDHPDYSWTFQGSELSAEHLDASGALDLGISVSERGTGLVASLLADTDKTVVLDFAHTGVLPAPATIYVAAPASMREGEALGLYLYDEGAGVFKKQLDGLSVESGYLAFETDHCSIWAISATDLSMLFSTEVPDALNPLGVSGEGSAENTGTFDLAPVYIVLGALLSVVVAIVLVLIVRRRRSHIA
jgi:hypothetical protein